MARQKNRKTDRWQTNRCIATDRQADRQDSVTMDRQTTDDTQTNRHTDRQTDRHTDRQTGRQAGRQADYIIMERQTTDRQAERQKDLHTDRQTGRQTDRNLTETGNSTLSELMM